MSDRDLEQVTRLVVGAVSARLGEVADNRDVMELVVREVVSAMVNTAQVPPRSTPDPARGAAEPRSSAERSAQDVTARDNGDGTVTTALGSVLPMPTQPRTSLELCNSCVEQQRQQSQSRAVVSATGKNARGVVARVSKEIAEAGGDIQDISQTIVSDYFTMIMLVEISGLSVPFSDFKQRLLQAGEALGIHTVVMHEDVMRSLQRV